MVIILISLINDQQLVKKLLESAGRTRTGLKFQPRRKHIKLDNKPRFSYPEGYGCRGD
jgi:hypothetical protein